MLIELEGGCRVTSMRDGEPRRYEVRVLRFGRLDA